ncbi:MAG TPA: phospholipase D family protein [Burkholderiaceae bacterium]|jgi:phosphatidylserine/phosphatidylglycerophosphate/cardiolipin synthase-like enzyme
MSFPSPSSLRTLLAALTLACFGGLLGGCAGVLPQQVERPRSTALVAPPTAPLAEIAHDPIIEPGSSGVWPLLQASYALDARLALIEHATTSLDLQYYLIGDDATGRVILRALRDAALRGVRIRLLVDDLYTTDMDHLLLGLAAYPNVEVRLFNPFVSARDSSLLRLMALARDFKRLNHRMHNKLFIADGTLAIVGGRNLADEYFLRGTQGNFIDFDLLLAGEVVPHLAGWFDLYWNSPYVYPVRDIAAASGRVLLSDDATRARFESSTANEHRPDPPLAPDSFGAPAISYGLAQGRLLFLNAPSTAFADSPSKIDSANAPMTDEETLTHRFLQQLSTSRSEITMFSPYFIPGNEALRRIAKLRADGVNVKVVTNSLAVSDEPLVSIGLERHQIELLKMGVELYELSSERLKLDSTLKGLLGTSTGRLHAKMAFIDRQIALVGSMNLDPRSASINTEIGVRVVSPVLTEMVFEAFKVGELAGVYQVKLREHNLGVHWVAIDGEKTDERDIDPDTSLWQRMRLLVLSWFVPESQL